MANRTRCTRAKFLYVNDEESGVRADGVYVVLRGMVGESHVRIGVSMDDYELLNTIFRLKQLAARRAKEMDDGADKIRKAITSEVQP